LYGLNQQLAEEVEQWKFNNDTLLEQYSSTMQKLNDQKEALRLLHGIRDRDSELKK
jgi:hypothetical protein